jgi:hypothetical protein
VDDRRVLLLDDRGWTSSLVRAIAEPDSPQDVPDFWDVTSRRGDRRDIALGGRA